MSNNSHSKDISSFNTKTYQGIYGYSGKDQLFGGDGGKALFGGSENDQLFGGNVGEALFCGSGNNWLFGGDGDDAILGGSGNDQLFGGDGDDELLGDDGSNVLTGGPGIDTFFIAQGGKSQDTITDFNVANEKIVLLGPSNIKGFKQLVITQDEAHAQIKGDDLFITLQNVTASELTEQHFIFDYIADTDPLPLHSDGWLLY
jgi:Ca2+-binding RTX toxin-like protein